ncbi:putative Cellulase [Seiridium unicorne]|uniref:cellulase n=1 Tax=Seiridium unicorne TaxID=138068 RepID=A0ABR2VJ14_9PEZI
MKSLILGSALAGIALAQGEAYAQCGGTSFSGSTSCVSGYACSYVNEYYSQCLVETEAATSTVAAATVATTTSSQTSAATSGVSSSAASKLKWFGINQSVAEFGSGTYPGVWGTDFYFPSTTSIGTLISEGYNIFRVAFAMERLVPDELTNTADAAYLANLTAVVDYITDNGAYAILDPHNFGRYYSNIITDLDGFGSFWTTVANAFKDNANVIFDTNNEYHDMDQTLVLNLNQAAIDAIRATGATSQYIFAEGNSYSGAWTWNTTNTNLADLTDSADKLIYEMHQYLDSDGSGTSDVCVSTEIGVQRVVGATEWLRENGKIGIIGEFAGGANTQCQTAITGLLDHLEANSDVWQGALWWAGGPWWGDYIFSYEPPSGTAYVYYDSLLKTYTP